jgi:hypothetical protein
MKTKQLFSMSLIVAIAPVLCAGPAFAEVSKKVIDSISTPNEVETSIGTLKFLDGAPYPETAEKVYDYLDTARAADAFLKGMPGCSLLALIEGAHSIGAVEAHEVMLFDKLMDAKSLFLTGNSSTVYCIPDLDLKRDGPTVVEVPDGLLGAANDGWFRFINNFAVGGKYLFLPPGYDGPVPDGFAVYRPRTYRVWVFLRSSVKGGELDKAVSLCTDNVKVYPLAKIENPPKTKFISASGKAFNTAPQERPSTRSTRTTSSSTITSTRQFSMSRSRCSMPKPADSLLRSGSRRARSSRRMRA